MVDVYTGVSALANLVTTAYDKALENQNRHLTIYRGVADKFLVDPTHAGNAYTLQIYNDLPETSAALSETTEPDAVALPATTPITVNYAEFGRLVVKTFKLSVTSMAQVDPMILDNLSRDLRVSLDNEVSTILNAGSNAQWGTGGSVDTTVEVTAAMTLRAQDVRQARTFLRRKAAEPRMGELYQALIHPNVAHDLRAATGAGEWRDDHKYASPDNFWPGELGVYEGFAFQESGRVKAANDGAASATVYRTLFLGKQALAEVVWKEPSSTFAEPGVVDKLGRQVGYGWHGALNWTRYRETNLFRFENGSSQPNT
jgi:N4-gp56 family major capsid protein